MDATIVGRAARDVSYVEQTVGLTFAHWDQDDMPDFDEVVEVEHDGRSVGRARVWARRWWPANGPWPAHWRVSAERIQGQA